MRILFQGDSITDCGRSWSDNSNLGRGYPHLVEAELGYLEPAKHEFINRGISGNRVADLLGRWKEDCLNLKPTVLSILIGINDIILEWDGGKGSNPERYEKIYRLLLDEVLEQNPDTFIVIMEPFFGEKKEPELNEFFKARIGKYSEKAKKIAEDYNAVFVPLQDMFDDYAKKTDVYNLLWDGVHPTTCGHQLVARRWKEVVEPELNKR